MPCVEKKGIFLQIIFLISFIKFAVEGILFPLPKNRILSIANFLDDIKNRICEKKNLSFLSHMKFIKALFLSQLQFPHSAKPKCTLH